MWRVSEKEVEFIRKSHQQNRWKSKRSLPDYWKPASCKGELPTTQQNSQNIQVQLSNKHTVLRDWPAC